MMRRYVGRIAASLLLTVALFAEQHPAGRKGFNAEDVYHLAGIDNVNVINGNLTLEIPIGTSYSVGGGLSYSFSLRCNANVWDSEKTGLLPSGERAMLALPDRRANAGLGCLFSMGRLFPPDHPTNGSLLWLYETPDGSEHFFHETLHDDVAEAADSVLYTRDGSYLRMTYKAAGDGAEVARRIIEFPNGETHEFRASTTAANTDVWQLHFIKNKYPGNFVQVSYYDTVDGEVWTVSDSYYRTHDIGFKDQVVGGATVPYLDYVDTRKFQNPGESNQVVRYLFEYDLDPALYRPVWHTEPGTPDSANVPLLSKITQPGGSTFDLSYWKSPNLDDRNGLLTGVTLPTRGCVGWEWGWYPKPGGRNSYVVGNGSWGVIERTLYDRGCAPASEIGTWTYSPELTAAPFPQIEGELRVRMTDPLGNYEDNYFSVANQTADGFVREDYGRPITRKAPTDSAGRFLSKKIYDSNGTLLRTEYLTYERDPGTVAGGFPFRDPHNPRVASRRTVFNSDGGTYVDEVQTDFDGYGHYRNVRMTGTISSGFDRQSITSYNTDRGTYPGPTFVMIQPVTAWLPNLYSAVETRESGGKVRAEFCFDTGTGFLTTRRAIKDTKTAVRSATDAVVRYEDDPSTGDVLTELHYGGDDPDHPASTINCGAGAVPVATIAHQYVRPTYSEPALQMKAYYETAAGDPADFYSVDVDLDRNTGFIKTSRDTAYVPTTFEFDGMGRALAVKPTGRAWTVYTYNDATSSVAANVVVKQFPNGATSGTPLTEVMYEFDGIGRPVKKTELIPGDVANTTQQSVQTFTYDALGRKTFVSNPGSTAGTTTVFDRFGRVVSVQAADSSTATFNYHGGVRWLTRSSSIATSDNGQETFGVDEIYDEAGRLTRISELSGPTSASAHAGLPVVTEYLYDPASRLKTVRMIGAEGGAANPVQNRYFDYDGRGFLRWESHPESGVTSYTYDARGKVLTKDVGAAKTPFDLKYTYDVAERLQTLEGRDPADLNDYRPVKEFYYGTGLDLSSLERGKLVIAKRYNYPDPSTPSAPAFLPYQEMILVEEQYEYGDAAGRKTHRTTYIRGEFDESEGELAPIHQTFNYNDLDQVNEIKYPVCFLCGLPDAIPLVRLVPQYEMGRLRKLAIVDDYTGTTTSTRYVSNVTYWPNGMRKDLTHTNGVVDHQEIDATTGMMRPKSLTSGLVETCIAPEIQSVTPGGIVNTSNPSIALTVTVNANATGPLTYEWYRLPEMTKVADTATFNASPTTRTQYVAWVSNACNTAKTQAITVEYGTCVSPSITSASASRNSSGVVTLAATVTGTATLNYEWTRLSDLVVVGTTASVNIGTVNLSNQYRLKVTNGCGGPAAYATVDVAIPLTAPTGFNGTRSGSSVTLTWNSVTGATGYVIERRVAGSNWTAVPIITATAYVDSGIAADSSVAYRIRAEHTVNRTPPNEYYFSEESPLASAIVVTTINFTAIQSNVTRVSSTHMNELLSAVNSVRAISGWQAVTWSNILSTNAPLPASGNIITAEHLIAIRNRLNEALHALGVSVNGYADEDLRLKTIQAAHMTAIQDRLK